MIPYARQTIHSEDINAVIKVLRSDWLTQGPTVERFENAVAHYCGASYAIAVNSATSALHIACRTLGLGPGDWLWTSPNTFVASANCGLYCGAQVDFIDIDPHTYNLDVHALEVKLKQAAEQRKLPKIIIPVHFAGQSCAMQEIARLAKQYGIAIIEDASHAIGAQYQHEPVGNCRYSDITIFSFHAVKMITTGEGGMALTNRPEIADLLRLLRTHGITRDTSKMNSKTEGAWYYEQCELGWNYRMTDFQAALGISQLRQLDTFVDRRRQLALHYHDLLAGMPLTRPWQQPEVDSSWHLYAICLDIDQIDKSRRQIFDALREAGIGVNVHYIPVHTQPYFRNKGFSVGDFPKAEYYYARALSLPLFPELRESEQGRIVNDLFEILS